MSPAHRARPLAVALAFLALTLVGVVTAQRQSAAEASLVVWPIGDSITYGVSNHHHSVRGGYRLPLARDLLARGVRIHYVGTTSSNPSPGLAGFGQRHDGHSGWQTSDVLEQVNGWQVPTPDVVLVALGTNDLRRGHASPEEAATRLGRLVTVLTARLPRATIVLTAVVPSGRAGRCDGRTRAYDGLVRELVREETIGGLRVQLADAWSAFVSGACATRHGLLSADRLHPSAQGYAVMGGVFADVLARLAEARRTLTP